MSCVNDVSKFQVALFAGTNINPLPYERTHHTAVTRRKVVRYAHYLYCLLQCTARTLLCACRYKLTAGPVLQTCAYQP